MNADRRSRTLKAVADYLHKRGRRKAGRPCRKPQECLCAARRRSAWHIDDAETPQTRPNGQNGRRHVAPERREGTDTIPAWVACRVPGPPRRSRTLRPHRSGFFVDRKIDGRINAESTPTLSPEKRVASGIRRAEKATSEGVLRARREICGGCDTLLPWNTVPEATGARRSNAGGSGRGNKGESSVKAAGPCAPEATCEFWRFRGRTDKIGFCA